MIKTSQKINSVNQMSNTIIKWAGGKEKLREKIVNYFPTKFDTYIEPFCGGAAIALNSNFEKVKINDLNQNLINMYQCLRDDKFSYVCEYLQIWQDNFPYLTERFYKQIREDFKEAVSNNNKNLAHQAALFIALNKLGFNGLYRENQKGIFNVPWGKRGKNTKIYDRKRLEAIHERLQNFSIYCGDYTELTYFLGDFVYLDPPYDVASGNFTSYNKTVFGKSEQARLSVFCDELTNKNVKFCQSNADTPYIRELYRNYRIVEIEAPRRISCNGDRTNAKELLIINYEK